MPTIPVATPQATYEVTIAPGLLRTLNPRLCKLTAPRSPRTFVITSPEIWALWHDAFLASFPAPAQPTVLFLPSGESHKRLATVESLAQQLALAGADRDSLLLAFGGGVIGDVTGFLAATYMRGIGYVGIPTTLLAQVDSSLGGKTGVNLLAGKNLIGAFHHPLAVYSDIDVLSTLPPAELRSGLQEAIKSAIIRDINLFRYLKRKADSILGDEREIYAESGKLKHGIQQMLQPSVPFSPFVLAHIVTACVRIKAEVVAADEKESGLRMVLNFGHTIGHAIEAATGYRKLLHGEAIAWGMIAALHVSLARRRITQRDFDRMTTLILRYGPIPAFKAPAEKLVALTSADKKTRSGRRAFVLTTGIGSTEIAYDVTDAELLAATQAMLKTMQ